MSVEIRDSTVADIPTVIAIRTSVRENHLSVEDMARMGITPETIRDAILAGPCLWIAEIDGAPAGFAMVDTEEGSVFAAFVRPEFEGRGIGRKLMERAEASLFSRHDRLWLETDGASRAAGFYHKLGWHSVERFPNGDVRFEKLRLPTG